jgi:Trk K+ transport system NAD-binding subunit
MPTPCRDWTGHIIVCGLHGVGLRTVEQLHLAGVAVVVVDDDPDRRMTRVVASWDIPHVDGDSRSLDVLEEAGLAGAAAVVCVEPSDLHALETALLTRQARPDVRLVVQLSNPAVGRAVADVTGKGSVLDVAALAAPSVVEACLSRRTHPLNVGGERFLAAEIPVELPDGATTTLRELFGDLVPIAVIPPAQDGEPIGELVVCPGRDLTVAAGQRVVALGTASDFAARGLRPEPPSREIQETVQAVGARFGRQVDEEQARNPGKLTTLWRLAVSTLGEADRPLRFILAGLVSLMALSTIVLMVGYRKPDGSHMTILDAVYFTIETVGTIGYGDFSFAAQESWLRAYAIVFMLTGAMLAAIGFALFTNLLVSRRIEESLGRRQMGSLADHVIVIGVGAVGLRVVEGLLAEGKQVVVIDRDEGNRYLSQVRALDVPVLIGDATQARTLVTANLGTASAIAILTSDDLVNIETGLVVRDQLANRWAHTPVVLRLFDRQLGQTVEDSFGFRHVRSTAALAAPWFVGSALGLDVLSTFYVEHQPFLVATLVVAPGGGLDGLAMQNLSARIRVVAIERVALGDDQPKLEHPPRSDTRFGANDRAYLVGPYEELLQVLRRDSLSPSQLGALPTAGEPTPNGARPPDIQMRSAIHPE